MTDIEKLNNGIDYRNSGDIFVDAKVIIDSSQRVAHSAVNASLVLRNWLLGRRIAEEQLGSATRQELYGQEVVERLAAELTNRYGRGYTKRSLYQYVQFYRLFPEIVPTASAQSLPRLSWSHYSELLRVDDPDARSWYEQEAFDQGWAVKTLRRNINTQYYHRLLARRERARVRVGGRHHCEPAAVPA